MRAGGDGDSVKEIVASSSGARLPSTQAVHPGYQVCPITTRPGQGSRVSMRARNCMVAVPGFAHGVSAGGSALLTNAFGEACLRRARTA